MKHIIKLFSLALCAALLLSLSALAAEVPAGPADTSVLVSGQAAKQEDGSLLITNASPDAVNPEVIVRLPEDTPCVDGVTGEPMTMETVKDGDTLYIWAGPAMTMSLPPQTTAKVVVGGVPADGAAPQYAEITGSAVSPAPGGERRFPTGSSELTVLETASVTPYLTRNLVTLDDLVPGSQILAWTNDSGKADRIVLLPYAYAGYVTAGEDGAVRVNGEKLEAGSRVLPVEDIQQTYLPLRAVAEAAGYEVDWVSGKGAVVAQAGTELFSIRPGSELAQTADGEHSLLGSCVLEQGVTYLPAIDLAGLLQMYFCAE